MKAKEGLLDYTMATMKPTYIAFWNGIVMGSGAGMSFHAPIKIATEKTVFAMPETSIGYFTDVSSTYFFPRIKNNSSIGLYLALTGTKIKGIDTIKWGIATHFVPENQLDSLK